MTDSLKQSLRGGRYAVIRVLGEGAQAATFEAVDKRDGLLVAIKRFRVRGASSWKEVELAEREARVLASLSEGGGVPRGKTGAAFSPDGPSSQRPMPSNLPRYIEHFEEDGELFLVTEMIEGESLLALRKRGVVFSESDALRLLRDASAALEFLHGRTPPVIHRDIKPSNVLRRPDGSFAIIDFGSVRDRMKPEGGSTVVGTFGYMAPEQFQGRAMPTSDIYALGATALSMLTGEEPEKLPHRGLAIDVEAALKRARISPSLISMLSSMLDPDPDKRAARMDPLFASYHASAGSPSRISSSPSDPKASAKRSDWERKSRDSFGEGPTFSEQDSRGSSKRERRRDRKEAKREAHRAEREAKREAEHAEREAKREARMMQQMDTWAARRRGPNIPPVLVPLFLIGLTIAQVAVTLALGVFVPVMFAIFSIIFGKTWREAARTVRSAGRIAVAALGRAKDVVRGSPRADNEIRVRTSKANDPVRVRVEGETESWANEAERAAEEAKQAAEEEQAAHEAEEALRDQAAQRERRRR